MSVNQENKKYSNYSLTALELGSIVDSNHPQGGLGFLAAETATFRDIEYQVLDGTAPSAAVAQAPAAPSTISNLPSSPLLPSELTTLQQQYDKLLLERVTGIYDTDLAKLNAGYLGGLERAEATAQSGGQLDTVLAIQAEKKLIQGGGVANSPSGGRDLASPAPSAIPATDDARTPDALKNLRTIYGTSLAKLDEQRTTNHTALLTPYATRLKQIEADLTKAGRIPDAVAVKQYREGLGTNRVPRAPVVAATPASAATPATPAKADVKTPRIRGDDRKAAEWVLRNWTDFRLAIDGNKQVRTKDDLPKGKFAIESLAIDGRAFTGGTMTGEALQVLAGLEGLKTFTFGRFPDLKDSDMAFLSSLSALVELKLNNLGITDAVLPLLAGHRNLKKFDVGEIPGLTGVTLDQLAKTSIDSIIFWKCGLADEGVAKIALLPDLKLLDIQGHSGVTDASIPHLRAMPALTNLLIAGTNITPEGFGDKSMPKITTLAANNLAGLPLSEIAPKLAIVFPQVTSFTLSYFANTPEDLAALAHFKDLKVFSNYGIIKDEAWAGFRELRDLQAYLVANNGVSDVALGTLAELKKLKSLHYGSSKPPSEGALAAFKKQRPDVKVEP